MIRDSSLSLRMIFTRNVVWWIALSIVTPEVATRAQTLMPTPAPATAPGAAPEDETIIPTFETQKLARTYILDVPAPRGQITDRSGAPLAQNRLSYISSLIFRHLWIFPMRRRSTLRRKR